MPLGDADATQPVRYVENQRMLDAEDATLAAQKARIAELEAALADAHKVAAQQSGGAAAATGTAPARAALENSKRVKELRARVAELEAIVRKEVQTHARTHARTPSILCPLARSVLSTFHSPSRSTLPPHTRAIASILLRSPAARTPPLQPTMNLRPLCVRTRRAS